MRKADREKQGAEVLGQPERECLKGVFVARDLSEYLSCSRSSQAVFPEELGVESSRSDRGDCGSNAVGDGVGADGAGSELYDSLWHIPYALSGS